MRKKNPENEFLWVEKYRPQTLNDCILPERFMSELAALRDGGELNNLLFAGPPGCGKTTAALALCNDVNASVLLINASKDRNIDTLRTKVQNFAMTKSLDGKKKVVIFDEADYLNAQSTQPALRNFMEEFSHNCRFILTCNFPKKIIEPLHSRLHTVNFNFTKAEQAQLGKQFLKAFIGILAQENVEYDKKAVAQLILKHTPDYRKILGALQGLSTTGVLNVKGISTIDSDLSALAKSISEKDFTKCRKWVAENSDCGFGQFMKIRDNLIPMLDKQSIPELFLILNEFDVNSASCTDMEVHLTACIVNLMFNLEYV